MTDEQRLIAGLREELDAMRLLLDGYRGGECRQPSGAPDDDGDRCRYYSEATARGQDAEEKNAAVLKLAEWWRDGAGGCERSAAGTVMGILRIIE